MYLTMRSSSIIILLLSPFTALAARTSRDGTCGGSLGNSCEGSVFGNCCSQYSYCGKTDAYCGKGCNPNFGSCKGAAASISAPVIVSTSTRTPSPVPSATQSVSKNARCGKEGNGQTCLGSKWGSCCSQYSYCGSTIDYCAVDTCQKGFGFCNGAATLSISTSSTPSSVALSSSSIPLSSGTAATLLAVIISSTATQSSSMDISTIVQSASTIVIIPDTSVEPSITVVPASSTAAKSTPTPIAAVCTVIGEPCSLDDPGACCSQACLRVATNTLGGVCFNYF
ncbi:hypothetical protein EJ02DRAFT_515646 [Clathrospora elynae]|uniref:Chitin-binding type-1 domain-containing protein n=1 Tax=Clathrospora elynae TaxID=706981 RepID=A0A6A5SAN9_9PLEO|nr:hypothetical protein EJ02DRAFT_515646 [Clathrospora elynae]